MPDLDNFSLKVRNLKCFGESAQGFDRIKPFNLIIGRNNSGKSTLLDLVAAVVGQKRKYSDELRHAGRAPEIVLEAPLAEEELRPVFRQSHSGGSIPGNHWEFGSQLIGIRFAWCLSEEEGCRFLEIGACQNGSRPLDAIGGGETLLQELARHKTHPLVGKELRRISAERDISPEPDKPDALSVAGNGGGATNIIQNFINNAALPSELVETRLLAELNHVFEPDAHFTDIVCQRLAGGTWEVFLEEESKGRIPLSQSGSGIKTIILVLIYLHLDPVVVKRELSDFVFCFEELENNLHPALLRRLLSYLFEVAKQQGSIFFLTTHSNVEIDFFSREREAQIVHVTHDGKEAQARTVRTYVDNRGVLEDLDVRASDLLQANCVIWVEGPSDRIYLNRWIHLWSGGTLSEGQHYQCVFYGGRLLAHLSSEDPTIVEKSVGMLSVNRNAVAVMDSDKKSRQTPLNATKRRVKDEIRALHGVAWITKGREIENYVPAKALERSFEMTGLTQVGQYGDFFDHLQDATGEDWRNRKPLLAGRLNPHTERDDLEGVLDLADRLGDVCAAIRRWNGFEEG